MIYELRIYTCLPGRLPALHRRFETATLKLWEKHGIRPVGFWTTVIGEDANDLTYLLVWESLAERERKWAAFVGDPDWQKAKSESEREAQIVSRMRSQLLAPTAYSALK